MSAIGFVVWGIRNGFKNNWLAANVDVNVYQHLTDDMRQICNSTVDTFFSIEKIQDYTLLSIFNPNTKDHVQRKAYIALSIVIPNGYLLKGDVIGTLHAMMQTYELKQGNAMVNMVNAEDMKVHLQQLQLTSNPNTVPHARTKIGLFSYSDASEIQAYFQDPSIYEFKKVFFISGQNVALEKMQGIESVHIFSRPLFLTVSDFDPKQHSVTINNEPINATKSPIKTGDLIQFVERKTKRGKQLQVADGDVQVSMIQLFPLIIEPTKASKPPKVGGKNKFKGIVFVALLVGLIGGGAYFFLLSDSGKDANVASEYAEKIHATYDEFDTLSFYNIPKADSSAQFEIFKLENDAEKSIGSVSVLNPNIAAVKLNITTDTILVLKYKQADSIIRVPVSVEFVIPKFYKIKSGEGLSKIAVRFNIKKESLMRWNNITDENKIKEGQELKLAPETGTRAQQVKNENETSNNNSIKVEGTPTTEKPKPTEQPAPAAGNTQKDNANDLTPLKKKADKLIKELKQLGVEITDFEKTKNSCQDQVCLNSLIEKMKNEKQKI
jgi:LysM repeat protein